MKIAVTGGSGKAGRAVIRELLEHGHEVLNIDRVPSAESSSPDSPAPFLAADLTDFGEALEALGGGERLPGIQAVVHLAAIPSPVHATPDVVFRTNITSTHAVFAAAARLRLERVVWASSETTLGLPFDDPPDYAPIDEQHEPAARKLLRALEGARRGDGAAVQPLDRDPVRRTSLLEHHGARRLRAVPVLLGRPACPQVESLELCRREPRRPEHQACARGGDRGSRDVRHRRRRHRHAPVEQRADGRGLPGRPRSEGLSASTRRCSESTRRGRCSATSPPSPGEMSSEGSTGAMRRRTLGRTGLSVSELGYGAWGIGGTMWIGADDDESLRALRRAIELGVNFIDTAYGYGDGHSEELVGAAARQAAETVYVSSKIPPPKQAVAGAARRPCAGGLPGRLDPFVHGAEPREPRPRDDRRPAVPRLVGRVGRPGRLARSRDRAQARGEDPLLRRVDQRPSARERPPARPTPARSTRSS